MTAEGSSGGKPDPVARSKRLKSTRRRSASARRKAFGGANPFARRKKK